MRKLSKGYRVCFYLILLPVLLISCSSAVKKNLYCTYSYGGVINSMTVAPVVDPYTVEDIEITVADPNAQENAKRNVKFLFKIVYIEPPADDAAINIYVYHPSDEGPVLIHQLKYLPPYLTPDDHPQFGFTGLQNVYEPSLGRVFQYWCCWK